MSKDEINQFDATAGNNTDIEGINTSETMVPSAVNNAIRSLMSLLKKQDVGTHAMTSPNIDGGTIDGVTMATSDITVGSGKTLNVSAGTLTLANDQISGDKINGGSISSTFVGNLTGDVTGNVSGTAATVTTAAQPAITSVGTLTGLGIGAAASAGKLHVTHTTGTIGYFESTQSATNAANLVGNSTQTNSSANLVLQINGGTQAQALVRCNGDNSMAFFTGASPAERMRLNATGLIIGGTAASELLHLSGSNCGLRLEEPGGYDWRINNDGGNLNFSSDDPSAWSDKLTITNDGKVGIGTVSPTASKLQVDHTDGTIARFRTTSGSNNTVINITSSDAAATAGLSVGGDSSFPSMTFENGGSEKMRLLSGGDLIVGGTASTVLNGSGADVGGKFVDVQPGTAVTGGVVVGSTGRGGTTSADYRQGFFLRRSDGWSTSQSGMWKGSHSTNTDINYWERMKIGNSGGGGHIDFEINDDTKMTLKTDGRLGIGTLSPNSARLHLLNSAAGEQCLYADATHASYANINTLLVVTRAANSAYAFLQTKSSGGSDVEHNLRGDGEAYADASWNASGADYAEFFEFQDGNPDDEDRRGLSVVLDNEKIRPATDDDDPSEIIGVVSGNPCVVGDNAWNKWRGKYLRDDFGAYDFTEDGDRKLNPDFDEDQEYIPRSDRKEWSAVGLVGKLRVRKGQPIGDRWIKMRDINSDIEEYLVR